MPGLSGLQALGAAVAPHLLRHRRRAVALLRLLLHRAALSRHAADISAGDAIAAAASCGFWGRHCSRIQPGRRLLLLPQLLALGLVPLPPVLLLALARAVCGRATPRAAFGRVGCAALRAGIEPGRWARPAHQLACTAAATATTAVAAASGRCFDAHAACVPPGWRVLLLFTSPQPVVGDQQGQPGRRDAGPASSRAAGLAAGIAAAAAAGLVAVATAPDLGHSWLPITGTQRRQGAGVPALESNVGQSFRPGLKTHPMTATIGIIQVRIACRCIPAGFCCPRERAFHRLYCLLVQCCSSCPGC